MQSNTENQIRQNERTAPVHPINSNVYEYIEHLENQVSQLMSIQEQLQGVVFSLMNQQDHFRTEVMTKLDQQLELLNGNTEAFNNYRN